MDGRESSKMSQLGVAGKRFVAVAHRNEPVSATGSKQTWGTNGPLLSDAEI